MTDGFSYPTLRRQLLVPGKEGREIQLISNFYKMDIKPLLVYHYDVDIQVDKRSQIGEGGDTPSTSSLPEAFLKKFFNVIMDEVVRKNPIEFKNVRFITDQSKNLYTIRKLPLKCDELFANIEVEIEGRKRNFKVKLQLAADINLSKVFDFYNKKSNEVGEKVLNILTLFFNNIAKQKYSEFQRKFFDADNPQNLRNINLCQYVSGFINSVRQTEVGLALNLHLKTSCVISKSFKTLDELVRTLNRGKINIRETNKFIRHLRVFTSHSQTKIQYCIDGLVPKTPKDFTFTLKAQNDEKPKTISIHDYFKKEYKINLQNNFLVKTTGKNPRYLPMELCYLANSQFLSASKIDQNTQGALLLKSTHTPNVYFDKANKVANTLAGIDNALYQEFGISLKTKPIKLTGRALNTPSQLPSDSRGKFHLSAQAPKWGMFCFDKQVSKEDLKKFVDELKQNAFRFGLKFNEPCVLEAFEIKTKESVKAVFANLKRHFSDCSFVFVGIPSS